jgi:Zn finger protein HypA/HybF involved in hydrogenase expression
VVIGGRHYFVPNSGVHYMVGLGAGLPEIAEYLEWVEGRISPMPLTDDEKDRIREIERLRAEVLQEGIRSGAGLRAGPVVGACPSCSKPMQLNWQYCPFCGASSAATCPRCRYPVPQEEGVQFCPQCGGRAKP